MLSLDKGCSDGGMITGPLAQPDTRRLTPAAAAMAKPADRLRLPGAFKRMHNPPGACRSPCSGLVNIALTGDSLIEFFEHGQGHVKPPEYRAEWGEGTARRTVPTPKKPAASMLRGSTRSST